MTKPIDMLPGLTALAVYGPTGSGCCARCKHEFSARNVRTPEGMAETCISGLCEDCFEEVVGGEEEV